MKNDGAGRWIALAGQVAQENIQAGIGKGVGAVVVTQENEKVVAVAGDARWVGLQGEKENGDAHQDVPKDGCEAGNVMAHAAMRAIAFVARKRKLLGSETPSRPGSAKQSRRPSTEATIQQSSQITAQTPLPVPPMPPSSSTDLTSDTDHHQQQPQPLTPFTDTPLTPLEKAHFPPHSLTLPPNAYLCLELIIYLTHEPCVMCSMAIVHSRFVRVVFKQRMRRAGAMCAERDGLGYGLFWRPKEFNWKFLAFMWQEEKESKGVENVQADTKGIGEANEIGVKEKGKQKAENSQTKVLEMIEELSLRGGEQEADTELVWSA